jgi:hypothetical protein
MKRHQLFFLGTLFLVLGGCAVVNQTYLNKKYGTPDAAARSRFAREAKGIDFVKKIKTILDNRCVVCHACYDSPCQLKLSSYDGLERGGSKVKVYDTTRLHEADPTRLGVDAQSAAEWREKSFHPVLNERTQTPEYNRDASVLYQMLTLKKKNPLPQSKVLPDSFDFSLDRKQVCPALEEFDRFSKDHPEWGMPYGFPGISDEDSNLMVQWVEQGAPYEGLPPLSKAQLDHVAQWEAFLNGESNKEQLMSRFIYEHLFLAHFYFDDLPPGDFYEIVRSKTPPGKPLDLVVTRRVYDDPQVSRVYYRLRRDESTIVTKRHLPYALSAKRMARWKDLFITASYKVDHLPTYAQATTSNPFITFRDIPVQSRYEFILDEAEFTVMGFIKGPVCRGQVALNVVQDHFWVFFVNPKADSDQKIANFLAENGQFLDLPAQSGSQAPIAKTWTRYSKLQNEYLQKKAAFVRENWSSPSQYTMKVIWDGNGTNPNAALTVFRHFDSASVVKGLVGEKPKTSWVLGYALVERIHYLLVAGYDVYGNVGHQLNTRLYMDFLRMEAESQFLALLPKDDRAKERDLWYQGAKKSVKQYVFGLYSPFNQQTGIVYQTDNPKNELYDKLKEHLSGVLNTRYEWTDKVKDPLVLQQLSRLSSIKGASLELLPEVSFVRISGQGYFTLVRNTARANITSLLDQRKQRIPKDDTLTVAYGFIGDYPEVFLDVDSAHLSTFVDRVESLKKEKNYSSLLDDYGIRRTNAKFWATSDQVHDAEQQTAGIEAGLFDLNRYQNR